MGRQSRIVLLCSAVTLWSAGYSAGPASADDGSPDKKLSQLTGVIRWQDGSQPNQVRVTLHRWSLERWKPAEQKADVDDAGNFTFSDLSVADYWCVVVHAPGAGLACRQISLEPDQPNRLSITLKPAVQSFISVCDEQGAPLAGARLRSLEIVDGTEGTFYLKRGSERGLQIPVEVSDAEGRLKLPDLPVGVVLKRVHVEHPQFAAALLTPEIAVKAGEVAVAELPRGFPIRLRLVQSDDDKCPQDLTEVNLALYHDNLRHADSVLRIPYPVVDGRIEQRVQPGDFQMMWLTSENYFFTPWAMMPNEGRLHIAPGEHDQWTIRALPKVAARGRVVKADGTPVLGMSLRSEIENRPANGAVLPEGLEPWIHADWAETDARGEYRIRLAPGRGRIGYEGEGLPSSDRLDVTIDGTQEQRVPDIVIRDLPAIRGMVLGIDGQPAAKTIVRAFSDSTLRYLAAPTLTDDAGRFEIPLKTMPYSTKTETRLYEHQIIAFSPYESVGGMASIDLRDESSVGDVTIRMTPQPLEWPLSAMRDAFFPRERGEPDEKFRSERMLPENSVGSAVPELDGLTWLNTDRACLADFRGQFVFLDFYTTWCGPCRADFPAVKMVYDLYRDRGVTVIGVHDNSSPLDMIRKYAADKDMQMPIVVDQADGRILSAYEKLWLASGYPSYLLLDREGRLFCSDRCTPSPSLRVYKLEVVRQALLSSRAPR